MAAGFRSILPYRGLLSLSGGTIVPVAPLPSSPVSQRDLVSLLDIRSHAQRIEGDKKLGPTAAVIAKALRLVQDDAFSTNERLRRLSGSLNSVGLTRDASGNVVIQASTLTVKLPLQTLSLSNQNAILAAPPAAPSSAPPTSSLTWWVNEGTDELVFQVTYSTGVVKTGTINLV
jgi:hypothetical protein